MLKALLFWGIILFLVGGILFSIIGMVFEILKRCILGITGYLNKYFPNKATTNNQISDQKIDLYIQQNKDNLIITSFKEYIIELISRLNNKENIHLEILQEELKELNLFLHNYYGIPGPSTQPPIIIIYLLSKAIDATSKNTILIYLYEILDEIKEEY